ncbi:hypothetical protein ACH4FX_06755 [Streptomyces sp. NPDC018019]|uniref:hypothetical protein n=1 Tax=Streptomyces sp. NPDC018019 TaxID=3365030 RepID=UPI0037A644A9
MDALTALGRIPCPDLPVEHAEQCWTRYLDDPDDASLFVGDTLLHTDWNPSNVITGGDTAHVVDGAWRTRGAAWIEPACWAVWLTAADHTTHGAEQWAAKAPTWAQRGDTRCALPCPWPLPRSARPKAHASGCTSAFRRAARCCHRRQGTCMRRHKDETPSCR